MSLRMLVSIMVAILFLVSGAYSFEVSVYGADGGSSFTDKLTINALEQDSLLVNSVVSGAALLQDGSGFGDLHKSFAANNRRGEKASITADVVGAGYWEYYQPEIFTDPTSASVSGFGLTALDAASIKCAATAQNRLGEKASAGVQVTDGSLYNYWANANAYSDGVQVHQSFDEALGQNIAVTERAATPMGSASTIMNVQNGGILGYEDDTFVMPFAMETFGAFWAAEGTKITADSLATKPGFGSSVKMAIEGTIAQKGSMNWYYSAAGMGPWFGFETGAGQGPYYYYPEGIDGGIAAQGISIEFSDSSVNLERDLSSTSLMVRGTEDQPASVGYYWDFAESFSNAVSSNSDFYWAEGDCIKLSAASSNARRDMASADAWLNGGGSIEYGRMSSSSSAMAAWAGNGLDGASAAEMDSTAIAFNRAVGRATVHSNIQNGTLSISNSASANSSAQRLVAEQEATVFGPALVQADATAINVLGKKDSAGWSMYVTEEYPLGYGQNASVIAGVPAVSMWAVL